MNTNKNVIVSISTDPVPDREVVPYLKEMQDYRVDYIHCDVMDGNFVPTVSYDYKYVASLNTKTIVPLDVHLMIEHPERVIDKYIEAGANIVTVHYESYSSRKDLIKDLVRIRELGALAGVAICPGTEVNNVVDFLNHCDVILVMGVIPGVSGQQFLENVYLKIRMLDQIRKQFNFKFILSVDGGINKEVAEKVKEMGADMIVSGTYIYNADERRRAIRQLKLPYESL